MSYSWFKVNLTEFAKVWSSSAIENVDLLGSEDEPYSITVTHRKRICNQNTYSIILRTTTELKKQQLLEIGKKN